MKKLLIVGGILGVLAIAALFAATFFLGNIVTAGVNRVGPRLTQTKVTLASAQISPFSGTGTLNGFVLGNPQGWSESNLCTIDKIHLSVVPTSLLGDHIVINEITIDAPQFNYETKIVASNVSDLLKNIEQGMGGGKDAALPKDGKPVKFEVKKLRLTNGKVRLGIAGTGVALPMPDIVLADIGTAEGGITMDQFAVVVMKSITSSVIAATTTGAGQIGGTAGAAAAEGFKKAGDAIKGLFGGEKKSP